MKKIVFNKSEWKNILVYEKKEKKTNLIWTCCKVIFKYAYLWIKKN